MDRIVIYSSIYHFHCVILWRRQEWAAKLFTSFSTKHYQVMMQLPYEQLQESSRCLDYKIQKLKHVGCVCKFLTIKNVYCCNLEKLLQEYSPTHDQCFLVFYSSGGVVFKGCFSQWYLFFQKLKGLELPNNMISSFLRSTRNLSSVHSGSGGTGGPPVSSSETGRGESVLRSLLEPGSDCWRYPLKESHWAAMTSTMHRSCHSATH